MRRLATLAAAASLMLAAPMARAADTGCPEGGINYGVIPYDSSASFRPLYRRIGEIIGAALGCPVNVRVGSSYT